MNTPTTYHTSDDVRHANALATLCGGVVLVGLLTLIAVMMIPEFVSGFDSSADALSAVSIAGFFALTVVVFSSIGVLAKMRIRDSIAFAIVVASALYYAGYVLWF